MSTKLFVEVDAKSAQQLLDSPAPPLLIDVREQNEWDAGYLRGAVHAPKGTISFTIASIAPDKGAPILLYCAGGVRSAAAAETLAGLGYTNLASMAGGINGWSAAGLPVVETTTLTPAQKSRYSRHLLLPGVGAEGQQNSRVLMVGAGGLGAPAGLYLAAAGVGHLRIIDFDAVEASNLQRQVIHTTDRVGMPKVESAATQIRALNPDVNVEPINGMLTVENVASLLDGVDLVIDGTDTFEARYALNDAAVRLGIPVVHAGVFRFEGQLTVLAPGRGPCYRCLHPTPPPAEMAPGCGVAGVLGVLPGAIGVLQATEALKVLLGIGEPLIGRLLLWDALEGSFTELTVKRDPHCVACGDGKREEGAA
jgi:molybdopterin/thiamine biosynthesis adenylyltransferase/rhodanese-related sulfurtransferase